MRLIDADGVIERLQEWNTSDATDKALYNFALQRLLESKTVDAMADLLRCKDCIHWSTLGDKHICSVHNWISGADDYCSFGEKG